MADAIPVSDPGLLAAQAKAGQAGVDAYNAAISTLQQQKQGAVQTALQEAAMRGAPAGAAQSQSGIIATPYDQRIASLTQGLGSYQASQAARTGRMNDYNAAVQGARSYIPQQVELAVAPIRARADFEVRNTEMEGQQRVAGIDADTRLTLARMAAAFQAAQIAAAKKAAEDKAKAEKLPALNQGELSAMMTSRAQQQLGASGEEIRRILSANEAATLQRTQQAVAGTQPKADAARNQNYWDLQAASYTGKAVQEYAGTPRTVSTSRDPLPLPMRVPPTSGPGATIPAGPSVADPYLAARELENRIEAQRAGQISPVVPAGGATGGAMDLWRAIQARANVGTDLTAGRQQVSDLAAGVAKRQRGVGEARLGAALTGMGEANREFTYVDAETGRRAYMTQAQAEGLDPFTREMLMGATQQGQVGLRSFEDVVWGAPSEANQGVGNPYSSDVVRNAMLQAAEQIGASGLYDMDATWPGQVANAMPTEIPSIYDLLAKQSGQPSSQDVYKAATAATADEAKAAEEEAKTREEELEAGTEQQETEAEGDLMSAYGRLPPTEIGTSFQVRERLLDNQEAIKTINAAIDDIITGWDPTRGAINAGQVYTQLMQSDMDPALKNLIPLALFTKGLG